MIWLAFTIGFLGSLHCVGMCGPLALGIFNMGAKDSSTIWRILQYHMGKTSAYVLLGLLIGLFGELFWLSQAQKGLSIGTGIVFILLFIFSLNIEKLLHKVPLYIKIYAQISKTLAHQMHKMGSNSGIILGFLNGMLPCGLVYLALAGALVTADIFQAMIFMFAFGIGTIPALIAFVLSPKIISFRFKNNLRKALPYLQLLVGIVLLYRGFEIDFPKQLEFWSALQNPILCH